MLQFEQSKRKQKKKTKQKPNIPIILYDSKEST